MSKLNDKSSILRDISFNTNFQIVSKYLLQDPHPDEVVQAATNMYFQFTSQNLENKELRIIESQVRSENLDLRIELQDLKKKVKDYEDFFGV